MASTQGGTEQDTSAPIVFKKRKTASSSQSRQNARSASPAAVASRGGQSDMPIQQSRSQQDATTNPAGNEDEEDTTHSSLQELLALRRLKQSIRKEGTDLEKLNGGNAKPKAKKRKVPDDAGYGLNKTSSSQKAEADSDDENNPEDAITRKIMKTDNFTHQTGILDVDKHMMAYIERELKKKRGQQGGDFDAEKEVASLDPHDELYKVAEKYRIHTRPLDEGSVATSSAMLTAIPEVDLGIDNRLKNIEETEKAKRKLQEVRARTAASLAVSQDQDYHDPNYAGSRFFRHARGNQTDFDILRAAKIEAGIEDDSEDEQYEVEMKKFLDNERKMGKGEHATDDIVAERYKRNGLLNHKGRR